MTATQPRPSADAQDRDILSRILHSRPGVRFNVYALSQLTGIPSERCFRACSGAPGVHELRSMGATIWWVSA